MALGSLDSACASRGFYRGCVADRTWRLVDIARHLGVSKQRAHQMRATGLADAWGFEGDPGYYDDNAESFEVRIVDR